MLLLIEVLISGLINRIIWIEDFGTEIILMDIVIFVQEDYIMLSVFDIALQLA